jgi:hypothetical protein
MFIGHFAVAFAGKRFAPKTSLPTLIAAAQLLDLLWPLFLMLGWERVRLDPGNTAFTPLAFVSYPISHSLLAALGWATLFALLYYLVRRYFAGATVIWIAVVSHWLLDFITHRPDLPVYPGGELFGLGLWNSVWATVLVEGLMFAIAVWTYVRVTRASDRIGDWGLRGFVSALAIIYVANIFSPPPSGTRALAIGTLAMFWLLILWAWGIDRHRQVRTLKAE